MKNCRIFTLAACVLAGSAVAYAQYRTDIDTSATRGASSVTVLTLEDALRIALSENVSVQVADQEIQRYEYAKKGVYASLFPQIDATGSYSRTLKKQTMYMDVDYGSFSGGSSSDDDSISDDGSSSASSNGIQVGRDNTFSAGVSASMPLVNAQLWKNLKISGQNVELAVEQARSSRLDMVTQVKQAFYAVLLAKEAFKVYKDVYENAVENFRLTEKKYNASRASELEYTRAKSNVAAAIPNVYDSESAVILALWQLKAVIGIDLDMEIDVAGGLEDWAEHMFYDIHQHDSINVENNTSMRQLEIQAEQLAESIRYQQYAYIPTLSASFSWTMNAMENSFNFSEYKWTPYSYLGVSLSIPIFSGGARHNAVRQAKVQATELELQRLNTERELKIAVKQYLTTMETQMKTYISAQEAVNLAQKSYDITVKSYDVGKSTLTDLNDAQLVLTQAKLSESQAIYNFVVAKSNLEKTLGHDFLDDEGQVSLEGSYSVN